MKTTEVLAKKCLGNFKLIKHLGIEDFETIVSIWKETVPALVMCHSDQNVLRALGNLLDSIDGKEVFGPLRWHLLEKTANRNTVKVLLEQIPGSPRQKKLYHDYAKQLVTSEIARFKPKKRRVYNGRTGYIAPFYVDHSRLLIPASLN